MRKYAIVDTESMPKGCFEYIWTFSEDTTVE